VQQQEVTKSNQSKILIKSSFILLLGGAFVYYFYSYNPAVRGTVFLRCPSNFLFGINCPGCGSQRAIHYLLHLDILEALQYNPLLVICFPFILYITFLSIYNFVFDKKIRIKLFYNNKFVWTLFVVVVMYGVLRNLPFYPFTLLSPPV